MPEDTFNLVVVGGGAAGLVAAYIGASAKARVALLERHKMGGDCLYTGCIPSKSFLKTAKVVAYGRKGESLGIPGMRAEASFEQAMERVQRIIRTLEPQDSSERYSAMGVKCFEGEARISGKNEVEVGGRKIRALSLVLATGARSRDPGIPGLSNFLNAGSVWRLRSLPKRLVVLGGGPMGCELAQAFRRFGSQVALVEKSSRLLPREDIEVGKALEEKFHSEGIQLFLGEEAKNADSGKLVLRGGACIPFDQVLSAMGRVPNLGGLEKLELTIRFGGIAVDHYMRTNIRGVFAAGDCAVLPEGSLQFTHFASESGSAAALNALAPWSFRRVDTRAFPRVVFSDPEVARVGLTEEEALASGISFEVTRHEFRDLDRAIAEDDTRGFLKILTRKGTDRILGALIVGPSAGELIMEFTLAMQHGLGLKKILATIHPYPTFSEISRRAAGDWFKTHSSLFGSEILARYHRLRRDFF